MPITDFLERNAREFGDEVALVELSPSEDSQRSVTWKEYNLIEDAGHRAGGRREITWRSFDDEANRFANLLLTRGVQ